MNQKLLDALNKIQTITTLKPTIAVILGSGLDGLTDKMTNLTMISFSDIPHFIKPTTVGHQGAFYFGKIEGKSLLVMKGRFHYYEGYPLSDVTFPIQVMAVLGIKTLIISNACGAVNKKFKAGEMMLINDHLNLVGNNPLIGPNNEDLGPRFPDASNIYSRRLIEKAYQFAKQHQIHLNEGVYAWWSGPSYETPAEIRMIRLLGADAVGMSTVPESLVASHAGIEVLGIACLTNMATGITDNKLTHEEVLQAAKKISINFGKLVYDLVLSL